MRTKLASARYKSLYINNVDIFKGKKVRQFVSETESTAELTAYIYHSDIDGFWHLWLKDKSGNITHPLTAKNAINCGVIIRDNQPEISYTDENGTLHLLRYIDGSFKDIIKDKDVKEFWFVNDDFKYDYENGEHLKYKTKSNEIKTISKDEISLL